MEVGTAGCMPIFLFVFDGVGVNLKISVVDLSTGEVATAKPMRAEGGWTVEELKQYIGEVRERIFCHLYVVVPFLTLLI